MIIPLPLAIRPGRETRAGGRLDDKTTHLSDFPPREVAPPTLMRPAQEGMMPPGGRGIHNDSLYAQDFNPKGLPPKFEREKEGLVPTAPFAVRVL